MPLLDLIRCQYCGRCGFSGTAHLSSHIRQTHSCYQQALSSGDTILAQFRPDESQNSSSSNESIQVETVVDEDEAIVAPPRPERIRPTRPVEQPVPYHDIEATKIDMHQAIGQQDWDYDSDYSEASSFYQDLLGEMERLGLSSEEEDPYLDPDPDDQADRPRNADLANPDSDEPNTRIKSQFREYCSRMLKHSVDLQPEEMCGIRLLDAMWMKRTPLNAYDDLMTWHFRQCGWILPHQRASESPRYRSRKTIIDLLTKRYNGENKFPFQKKIILPVSGTVALISLHDMDACIQRLLTDPRIEEKDYLFFDDDPLAAPPPGDMEFVGDLITGLAYRDTHKALITPGSREQLLGIPMYIDGAAVSQFHHMEIIAVKISLSILTQEARLKEHAWVTIGYIEPVHNHGSKVEEIKRESNHMAFQTQKDPLHDRLDAVPIHGVGTKPIQDWHAMMTVILEGMVKLQPNGFKWDLPYKGIVTKDIHYKTFVPFIKCDNKEADAITGRYQDYSKCKCICRTCHIPRESCDDHTHTIVYKTKTEITNLVSRGNTKRLKEISQNVLTNAFDALRFSTGNDRGVHGSCPSEMLHQLLLGVFSYLREIFFQQVGKDSKLASEIDGLSKAYCEEFKRKSDRTLPLTSFSKGLRTGHLMAKEFRGILLIMLCCLRSTRGVEKLQKRQHFSERTTLDNWIVLVETMLEWEAFLNRKKMSVKLLKRLKKKHRYIMWLTRFVAPRTKGEGLKLIKFHAILHAVEDILQFGIPVEFDTSANESHHKPSKQAAKLTQRSGTTFTNQTAKRLVEHHLVQLGMEELDRKGKLWECHLPYKKDVVSCDERNSDSGSSSDSYVSASDSYVSASDSAVSASDSAVSDSDSVSDATMEDAEPAPIIITDGTKLRVFNDEETGAPTFKMLSKSKYKEQTTWLPCIVNFLVALQTEIQKKQPSYSLPIFCRHKRGDQIFRGHPNFRGQGMWNDWVWVNWGPTGKYPCEIWCFLVLEGLPERGRHAIKFEGETIENGTYAVCEFAKVDNPEIEGDRSEILIRCSKEVELDSKGMVLQRKFVLADTEAFVQPCAAVPDIGGPPNRYFVVQPREEWAEMFIAWVNKPHNRDEMYALGDEESSVEETVAESEVDEGEVGSTTDEGEEESLEEEESSLEEEESE